jgi:hypothetical protein
MDSGIYTRHNSVPLYNLYQSQIDAKYYNHVQITLKRLGKQIRFKIPGLNHLDLILQQDAWIVVDRVHNDVPVLAWTDFDQSQRDNLHKPLQCQIRMWHYAAAMIKQRTLEAMETILTEELASQLPDDATILPFNKSEP